MSYRDDHDAALRRAADLERKLKESEAKAAEADALRAELERVRAENEALAEREEKNARKRVSREQKEREEERKRELREKRAKKGKSSSESGETPWYKNAGGWLIGIGMAGFVGALVLWTTVVAPIACDGENESSHLVTVDGAERLLLVAEVSTGADTMADRVTLLDPSSGKRIATTADSVLRVVAPRLDRVWMKSYDDDLGLHVRDLATLELVATSEELRARHPELATGFEADGACATGPDVEGPMLPVLTKDGRRFEIDTRDLSVRPRDRAPPVSGRYCRNSSVSVSGAKVGGVAVGLHGHPRKTLKVGDRTIAEGESFLDGSFVGHGPSGEAIVLDHSPGLLVSHKTTMEHDAIHMVTRVSLEGRAEWTIRFDEDQRLQAAYLAGDHLVLVTRPEVMGVDPASGTIGWKTPN